MLDLVQDFGQGKQNQSGSRVDITFAFSGQHSFTGCGSLEFLVLFCPKTKRIAQELLVQQNVKLEEYGKRAPVDGGGKGNTLQVPTNFMVSP